MEGLLLFAAPIAGGGLALAVAGALAAAPVFAADREPAAFVATAQPAAGELARLLDGAPALVVAGERLNAGLLRRFYARHGFAPVWTTRPEQADALMRAVLRAGEEGLAPQLFRAGMALSPTLPPLQRDLLLSDAFLAYADALARGAVPVERRRDDEALTPGSIDVAAALDAAIARPDPAAALAALAPATPTYRLLRETLQNLRPGAPTGRKAAPAHLREVEVNLERERWLPRPLPPDRVWVNVADQELVLYRDNEPVFSTRLIVGQDELRNQSPEFEAKINGILFNPPWNVPKDIATDEILPKTEHDPEYLSRHNMVVLPDGGLQQRPGPNSALAEMMFDMENRFDVYLHDTPGKNLFSRKDRRISHGCLRVEKPRELASFLMRQSVEAIERQIATGSTTLIPLPRPMPVLVVYETAFADADGRLQFRPDVYGRDTEIWTRLDPERHLVAEREPRPKHRR